MKTLFILIIFLFSYHSVSYERSDAFIVTAYSDKIAIVAPPKFDPKLNVIVVNKTLIKLLGKIETGSGKVLAYISVPSGKSQSIEVGTKLKEQVFFIPMAPAFQRVQLNVGSKPYEIPPKE